MSDEQTTAGHIMSPATGKFLCNGGSDPRTGLRWAGLDNAYRDSVTNGIYPCRECVRTAALAMGLEI